MKGTILEAHIRGKLMEASIQERVPNQFLTGEWEFAQAEAEKLLAELESMLLAADKKLTGYRHLKTLPDQAKKQLLIVHKKLLQALADLDRADSDIHKYVPA